MKKISAITILVAMVTGLFSWSLAQIYDHEKRIVKVETQEVSLKELVIETRDGVKELRTMLLKQRSKK